MKTNHSTPPPFILAFRMSLKRKALAKIDDNVAEPADADPAPVNPAPKKKKARKIYDGPKIGSYVDRDFAELPLWITSKSHDLNDRIKGITFACGGVLFTKDTLTESFHMTIENLKLVIESVGGKLQTGSPNSKTDIFIEGNLDAERTKSEPDKWSGSGKQIALQGLMDKNLEQPILVLSFQQFLMHFNLERECFLNSNVADFTDQKRHTAKPPGTRTRGDLFGVGLVWNTGPHATLTVLAKHNPFRYPYVAQFPNEALGFRGPRTVGLGAQLGQGMVALLMGGGGGRFGEEEEGEDDLDGCG